MSAVDRRELVLARLLEILSGLTIPLLGDPNGLGAVSIVPGNIVHNRNELPKELVPGLILLDGDETNDRSVRRQPRGQTEKRVPSQIMRMTPEIYIVLDVRSASNTNVGEDLNTARLAILKVVLGDSTLQDIVGNNGDICLDGVVTDLARNRTMKGQMGLAICFSYPLMYHEYGAS